MAFFVVVLHVRSRHIILIYMYLSRVVLTPIYSQIMYSKKLGDTLYECSAYFDNLTEP